jgi:hypothetical protein
LLRESKQSLEVLRCAAHAEISFPQGHGQRCL